MSLAARIADLLAQSDLSHVPEPAIPDQLTPGAAQSSGVLLRMLSRACRACVRATAGMAPAGTVPSYAQPAHRDRPCMTDEPRGELPAHDIRTLAQGGTVSLTGHRPGTRAGGGHGRYDDGAWVWVREQLPRLLDKLAPPMLWSGGALGFDQLGAFLALEHGTPVGLALPFEGFDDRWPDPSRAQLEWLKARAAKVVTVNDPGYAAWKLHARNDFLVDAAAVMIALWDGQPGGGTASTVAVAQKSGRPVVHMDPIGRRVVLLDQPQP